VPLQWIENVARDPQTYIFLLGAAAFWMFIERRIKSGVDGHFARQLESHKHELAMIAETTRHSLQRRASEFNLFVDKKHAAIAEVFKHLREAHGRATGLFGATLSPTFEEFNRDDIIRLMRGQEFPLGMQEEVLKSWESDRQQAIENVLRPYLRVREIGEAERALQDSVNAKLLNEIYLSDAILACADHLVGSLHSVLFDARHVGQAGYEPTQESSRDIAKQLHDLRRECRLELGYTSYEEPNQPDAI
jgi:hypothetical protein